MDEDRAFRVVVEVLALPDRGRRTVDDGDAVREFEPDRFEEEPLRGMMYDARKSTALLE